MIKFEHTEVVGWQEAIRGMRNPMNSWEKSDSGQGCSIDFVNRRCVECDQYDNEYEYGMCRHDKYVIGSNDHDLMMRLTKSGSDHAKYRRMITVYVDITAPLYWYKEYDTYKVGTVANSCSTMHKIADKEFTMEDFSHEHLKDFDGMIRKNNQGLSNFPWFETSLQSTIDVLNYARELYLATKDKMYWWQMIQLLPSSYNQKRTVMLNYEVLANMYHSRKNHKLDEWRAFCEWIKTLPYSEIITGEE